MSVTQVPVQNANLTRLESVQQRLREDSKYRTSMLGDAKALIRELGLDEEVIGDGIPVILNKGKDERLVFVREVTFDGDLAATTSTYKWPYRYCLLSNRTNRSLNIESWTHPLGIGIQEIAKAIAPGSGGGFGVAQIEEVALNKCNLHGASHLVRDNTNNKVLAESYNVTCGNCVNLWEATGRDDAIKVVESHPCFP